MPGTKELVVPAETKQREPMYGSVTYLLNFPRTFLIISFSFLSYNEKYFRQGL